MFSPAHWPHLFRILWKQTVMPSVHRGNEHRAPRGSLHFPFDRYLPTGNWKAHLPQFCCVFDASTLQLPLSVFLVNHRSYSASVCPSVQILSGGGGGFVIGGWVHLRDVCGTAFSGELGWVWSGVPFEGAAIFLFFLATSAAKQRKGASRYEVLKKFGVFTPTPSSALGTDLYYKIHAASLIMSAFP